MLVFTQFMKAIEGDGRIGVTHISLYMALLFQWELFHKNPFLIKREEVMHRAKIHSRHTYNVCMNQLHDYGYINYSPSFDPLHGSQIQLLL